MPLLTSVALPLAFTAIRQDWCQENASKANFDSNADQDLSMLSEVLLNCSFMKVQLAGFDIDVKDDVSEATLLSRAADAEDADDQ